MRILDAFSNAFKNTIGAIFSPPSYGRTTLLAPDDLRNDILYEEYANEEGRMENIALYKKMDDDSPEFCDALDSLSDLIIQGDDVQRDGYSIVSDTDNKQKIKKEDVFNITYTTEAKTVEESKKIEQIINDFETRTNLKYKLKYYVRNALKYGDYFGNIVYGEKKLSKQKVIAEILDIAPEKITIHRDEYGRLDSEKPYELIITSQSKDPIYYKKHEMFRIQVGGLADYEYGRSIAHSARKVYQQLSAIESGMVVGRLTRSHQRYLYKIDTSNMAPDVALEYVNKVKRAMTKKKMVDKNGNLIYAKSPMTAEEDIYLPVKRDSNDGVELLKSDEFLKNIDDVKYFQDKFYKALKVISLGSSDSKGSRNAVAELDIPVVRYVKGIQQLVRYSLESLYNMELLLHGINQKITIVMPDISSLVTIRKWDIERAKAETSKIYNESSVLSKEHIREYILCLTDKQMKEEAVRDKEKEARELELLKTKSNTQQIPNVTGVKNPQGGGSARTTTNFKNKRIKKASNTYVTAKNLTEHTEQQTESASE